MQGLRLIRSEVSRGEIFLALHMVHGMFSSSRPASAAEAVGMKERMLEADQNTRRGV